MESLKFTQILARCERRYLLVFDKRPGHWEFPTGGIEKGKSWQDCAVRATHEESGQDLCKQQLAYFIRGYFPKRRVIARGAVVTGTISALKSFQATDEIAAIRLCDPAADENSLDC
jgi:ADP-ribose pyrophosphatase YjhB (NUDIX family)